jgi:hypothetical protein
MKKALVFLFIGLSLLMPCIVESNSLVATTRGKPGSDPLFCTITAPRDGATVSGGVTVTVEASGTPTITIDGTSVGKTYSYEWNTEMSLDGSVEIAASYRKAKVSITVTVANGGSPPPPPPPPPTGEGDGVVRKYAVLVGISEYKAISGLSFCDEDVIDWYNHLNPQGFTMTILGDNKNWLPSYDGLATEANVKAAVAYYLSIADGDDIFVFMSSGHGYKEGKLHMLEMWDSCDGIDGEDGTIYDFEFKDMFAPAVCNWFIQLDHCYSGGMDEVMTNPNADKGYMATTCTGKGWGYDEPDYENGAWNYFFLEYSWQQHFGGSFSVSMEEVFAYAFAAYPYGGVSAPMEFDGNPSAPFYLA